MIRLERLRVYQQSTSSLVIGWVALPVDGTDVSLATVTLLRAYSENGAYSEVGTAPAAQGYFVDAAVYLSNITGFVFYKIVCAHPGKPDAHYGPIRLDGNIVGPTIGIIRNSQTLLRLAGEPALIYQRAEHTERCACWDPVFQQVTNPSCPICFNTGYIGGYSVPILTLIMIIPEPLQTGPADVLRQEVSTQATIANFPILRPRDVVYELGQGRRYRVVGNNPASYNRVIVNQTVAMVRLNPSDIEHSLPVPDIDQMVPVLKRSSATVRLQLSQSDNSVDIAETQA